MSRILFLTQVLPFPLDAGPKVRAYFMLRRLAERHQVTLVSFVRTDDSPEAVAHLRGFCVAVHTASVRRSAVRNLRAGVKGLLTGLPMVIVRDEMAEMSQLLRRLTGQIPFDVIHADQLSMAGWGWQAAQAARAAGGAPRTLLDEHNAVYLLAERMAVTETHPLRRHIMGREARAFRRYEMEMCRRYDAVLTVTAEDREQLLALFSPAERTEARDTEAASARRKFSVLPICVDPEAQQPVARAGNGPPTILHLGTMFWPPNVSGVLWFAREVLPRVHEALPEARFVVVGKGPPPEVTRLARDPRIEVTGYVADPAPYLAASDVFVVPLHAAGGMRVKILDAWLWGVPIVSTPIGAEGIECRDGENLLIAETPPAFAAAVVRLLTDGALNGRLRAAGRRWAEAHYGWREVYSRVDNVYAGLLGSS
jgi:glycosyltransferase involved in cell wall biosynthesis